MNLGSTSTKNPEPSRPQFNNKVLPNHARTEDVTYENRNSILDSPISKTEEDAQQIIKGNHTLKGGH